MKHIGTLDGFRAVAVLIVMLSHAGLGSIIPGGFGVTIFFFLSGYLITTLLVIEWRSVGSVNLSAFYLRRTIRIIPPMFICIAFTILLSNLGLVEKINIDGIAWDLLFLSNYAKQLGVTSNIPIPLWSLNVEEHFYLVFPLIFFLTFRHSRNLTISVIVIALLVVIWIRMEIFPTSNNYHIYYWTHTRIDSILYGCLLAVYNNPALDEDSLINGDFRFLTLGGLLILISFFYRDEVFREVWRYSIQGVGLFLIFNYTLRTHNFINRALSVRPLKTIADYSYVLYLIHYPMLQASDTLLSSYPTVLRYGIAFFLSFIFAAAMHRLVEQPLLHLRKRYQSRFEAPKLHKPNGLE